MNTKLKNLILIFVILFYPQITNAFDTLIQLDKQSDQIKMQKLSDNWLFYWQEFVDPEIPTDISKTPIKVSIPSYWSNYQINNRNLPGSGYGTFIKTIVLPDGYHQNIGLSIPTIDVAYCFYINGELISSSGKIGTKIQDEIPAYSSVLIKYLPTCDTLHLVFHVSNFHHRRGGIWKEFKIGPYSQLNNSYKKDQIIDFISLGILFSFGVFFLIFSFYYKEEKSLPFLSLAFLFILLRGITTNHFPITNLTHISWDLMIRLEYIGNFGAIIMGMWGFFYIKPMNWIRKILLVFSEFLPIVILSILFLKIPHFAYSVYLFNFYLIVFIILFCCQVFYLIKARDKFPWHFIVSILLVILAALNDLMIAFTKTLFVDFYILPIAFIIFVFILSAGFFLKFSETFEHEKKLRKELSRLNVELESIVEERTSRLVKKRKIIESQNELLQKDIYLKNRILSIIGHDIRSPLSFIVMGLDLISDQDLPVENRSIFIKKIQHSANNLFLLVDNLLSWGLSQNKQIKVFPEEDNLSILIDRVVGQFLPIAENKEIKLEKEFPSSIYAWFDNNTITIVVRNLISNAIKFTPRRGEISIVITELDHVVEVKVVDSGIGIPDETLKKINEGSEIISSEGTDQEKGTGLGLILCKELVSLNNGDFSLNSIPGDGCIISFTLPKKQPE